MAKSSARWSLYLIPLLAYFIYAYLSAGKFTPVSCSLFRFGCPQKVKVSGFVDPKYESIHRLFQRQFDSGEHIGAGIAVYVDGKPVVNLWGGFANLEERKPFMENTLTQVFSVSKNFESIAIAILVDRGLLDYKQKVSHYWPEYAQNGKENTTVEDVMKHAAGLPYFDETVPIELMKSDKLDELAKFIARQKPLWEPGTGFGYHAASRGFLVNELVRRVDPKKRNINQFVNEEISAKLGVEATFRPSDWSRVSKLYGTPIHYVIVRAIPALIRLLFPKNLPFWPWTIQQDIMLEMTNKDALMHKSSNCVEKLDQPPEVQFEFYKDIEILSSFTLKTNAKSLAKVAAVMANKGELDGIRLMSEETWELASQHGEPQRDLIMVMKNSFTTGGWAWGCCGEQPAGYSGWPGFGGSFIGWNPEKKIGIGWVRTGLVFSTVDEDMAEIVQELNKIVENN
jgi:CubicO group peptidase (beta-lactamase class C family)